MIYRIIGNDLPPRHDAEQSMRNLMFLLAHEPPMQARRVFVLNRLVDQQVELALLDILEWYNVQHPTDQVGIRRIPFNETEYEQIPFDYSRLPGDYFTNSQYQNLPRNGKMLAIDETYAAKNRYVMNNNGARNWCLADGQKSPCSDSRH